MRSISQVLSLESGKLSVKVLSLRYKEFAIDWSVWFILPDWVLVSVTKTESRNQILDFFYYSSSSPEKEVDDDVDSLDDFYHHQHHYKFK